MEYNQDSNYIQWKKNKEKTEDYVRRAFKLCLIVRGCKRLQRKLLSMADLEKHLESCPDCQKRMLETKLPNCINSFYRPDEEPFD